MSAPLPLLVPAPALTFKAVAGTYAPLEGVVTLAFAAVRFPDGSAMTADDFLAAQAVLTRTLTAGSTADVWDPDLKSWRAAAGADLTRIKGVALAPPASAGAPWQGVLAAGQTDAAGAAQLQPAVSHFPQYRLRGLFRARRDGVEALGLGPDSLALEFASATAASRFGADLTPDMDGATRARIVLRNAAAQAVGYLELDASGGNTVITLANGDTAGSVLGTITLLADGAIRLKPAAGRKVTVEGDFEADHIRYLPIGGLVRKDLS